MSLVQLIHVDLAVGGPALLENVDLAVERGERVCIVGRNGAGKSTLMRLIAGVIRPDDGEVRVASGVRIAGLAQEVPQAMAGSVFDVVAAGLGDAGALLADYHRLSHALDEPGAAKALGEVQARIEALHAWDLDGRVTRVLSRLELPEAAEFSTLSGGLKRRVLLAQALVSEPDVLLLDEPTNHLDIEAIDWLESFLLAFRGAIVFVTHDRRFLRALATRIVEIDRGAVTSWPGDYDNYLRRREERLHAEAQANAQFDRKLAQEEVWIRQGIKARRTRNEGRVRALEAMRRERAERRDPQGRVRLAAATGSASGRKVIDARDVGLSLGGRRIVEDFSTTILRGDRIGVIGPNGAGKTTLLRLLLGELAPQSGEVVHGTNLDIAYFDQQRAQLREGSSALENVADGREFIEIGATRKHVIGYLQDFLFTPERARAPITALSGGERNRLLLARLFSRPSNLLVMDEPTNDLDIETLELLEELLADYAGTLLLVSHDREFLDRVVTGTLVLEGDGRVGEYVGGYSDWLRVAGARRAPRDEVKAPPLVRAAIADRQPAPPPRRKLGYREARELEQLPQRIETLEADLAALTEAMQDAAFYQQDAAAIAAANRKLSELQAELDACYERWQELEG